MRHDLVFHSQSKEIRNRVLFVLVRPQRGGNVGAAIRATANMGMQGQLSIVGESSILNADAHRMAKHAAQYFSQVTFFSDLQKAIAPHQKNMENMLSFAATARVGSSQRPHPLLVRTAAEMAVNKLQAKELDRLLIVFGPEDDGLSNEEIALCDWVVTIPSTQDYRSLNLAQAVLIFAHELNSCLVSSYSPERSFSKPSQRKKLIAHLITVAEASGFVLPQDPFKMKPKLEALLSELPPHIKEIELWHGLLDQVYRSLKRGEPDFKGRYGRMYDKGRQIQSSGNGIRPE